MVHHGKLLGVNLFPGGKTRWYTNPAEAKAAEDIEVAKFTVADREREAKRLRALGILPERPLSYRVSLVAEQSGSKRERLQ